MQRCMKSVLVNCLGWIWPQTLINYNEHRGFLIDASGPCDTLGSRLFVKIWFPWGMVILSFSKAMNLDILWVEFIFEPFLHKVFTEALLVGAPRLAMMSDNVTKGCFNSDKKVFNGQKIIYPQCKKGVFAPSNFDSTALKRSSQLPDIHLELDFVYGYDG